ncbi:MAG: 3-deoxy-D-manno-octulosonic acid transferase [Planctomycetota bacterium]
MSFFPLRPIDVAYLLGALIASPLWLPRMIRTGKIRTDWRARFGRVSSAAYRSGGQPMPAGAEAEAEAEAEAGAGAGAASASRRPRVLFHAVSVGEVNAIRQLVDEMARDHEIVIATTTDTGFTRAKAIYGEKHRVVRYPFDFTWSIERFLGSIRPDLVALVELEVWPNFLRACAQRDIPVAVVNGRLSANSFRGYRRVRPLVRTMFRRLQMVLAQDDAIAERFAALGVSPDRIRVVGTMKWDNASVTDTADGADELARDFGIDRSRPLIVAGSTGPGEEALIRSSLPEGCQLLVAPRKPERFDEAANVLAPCRRRTKRTAPGSQPDGSDDPPPRYFLLDTIGELRAAYALADVVIVGRTFTPLRGSDMIEPIGLGRATIVGPSTENFESVTRALVVGGGLIQIRPEELKATLERLINDQDERSVLIERGRSVIRRHQGAVERHALALRSLINPAAADAATSSTGAASAVDSHEHAAVTLGEDASGS